MVLCEICKRVDFHWLVFACLQQCRDRQEAYYGDYGDGDFTSSQPGDSSWVNHHDDIFAIKYCAQECDLCHVILQAFIQRQPGVTEDVKGLPIVFRPFWNKIEVCYNTMEGLIKLCGLDLHMHDEDGE